MLKIKSINKKTSLIALGLLVAGVSTIFVLEATDRTHFFQERATSSTIPDTSIKPDSADENKPSNGDKSMSTNPDINTEKNSNPLVSGTELLAPSGSFVSNHNVDLSRSETRGQESVCTTTPGATCTITLKMGDVTKTLEPKIVGSSGTTMWTWDVKTAGLVAGTWRITATASLNSQTKSTTDLQNLEVK